MSLSWKRATEPAEGPTHFYPGPGGENACGEGEDEPATTERSQVTCVDCMDAMLDMPHEEDY